MATLAEQGKILLEVYKPWAEANNSGTAVIAPSLEDLWTMAFMTTDRPNVIIAYAGDEARGPFETAAATHRGDVTWHVGLFRGRGLEAERGKSLIETTGNALAYFDLLEQARDKARALLNISVEKYVDYKGTHPMETTVDQYGKLILGYYVEFSAAMDYPQLSDTPQQVLPV